MLWKNRTLVSKREPLDTVGADFDFLFCTICVKVVYEVSHNSEFDSQNKRWFNIAVF